MVSIGYIICVFSSLHWCNCYAKTNPDAERGFRVPFVPVFPIVGVIICLILMAGLPIESWERLAIWMAIGLRCISLMVKRSKLNNPDK
jgi:APA family basic amino acid/polyamine antiporter